MLEWFKNNTTSKNSSIRNLLSKIDENSIYKQSLRDEPNLVFLKPKLRNLNSASTDEIAILTKLYHEVPNVSPNFVEKLNLFLDIITNSRDTQYEIEEIIKFLNERELYIYFDFTYALSQGQIKFPSDLKNLTEVTNHWLLNSQNLALVNFALVFQAIVINPTGNSNIETVKKLLKYPETCLSACYNLANSLVEDKFQLNRILIDEFKASNNYQIRAFLIHFITMNTESILSEDKLWLILNSKEKLDILSQYKMNLILLSLKPDDINTKNLTNEQIISIFELMHILANEGPQSGLTINESFLHIINSLFVEIFAREKNGDIFFPIFFYKPFLTLLNFYKENVFTKLKPTDQILLQELINRIFDKFKSREEKVEEVDNYAPVVSTHKFTHPKEDLEIHFFENTDGKVLTVYPLIKQKKTDIK